MGLMMIGRQKYTQQNHWYIPQRSASEVELATEKLKSHRSPGIGQIPAKLIKAEGKTIRCELHKLIISIWNKEE
jgi:hypothetical protein